MRQIACRSVISLLLAIIPILASNRLSAQVQGPLQVPGTRHLIFSTYLGGLTPCATCPVRLALTAPSRRTPAATLREIPT
jgi:hypothetical protein